MPDDTTSPLESSKNEEKPTRNSNQELNEIDSTPPSPPNGGLKTWIRTFAAWLMFVAACMNFVLRDLRKTLTEVRGPALTFGDFQGYYSSASGPLAAKKASDIAWIGSLNLLLLITTGVVSGPLFDRGYLKPLMVVGTIIVVFGYMMTSLCTEYYQFMLAHGVCAGLGSGLLYVPALAYVSTNFTTRRPIAVGLTNTGASIGGIIFPILFRELLPQIGFHWTVRVMAFLQLGIASTGIAILLNAPVIRNKPRSLIDLRAFREIPFIFIFFMFFCHFLSFFIPLFFIPSFSTDALGASAQLSSYMLVIANAGTFFGRLVPNAIAQWIGAMNTVIGLTLFVAIIVFCWIAVHSIAGMVLWSFFWGSLSGGFSTVDPVVITHPVMSPSISVVGTRLGMAWVAAGIGILIGNPIAGTLGGADQGYLHAQIFAGGIMIGGLVFAVVPWWYILRADRGKRKEEKKDNGDSGP